MGGYVVKSASPDPSGDRFPELPRMRCTIQKHMLFVVRGKAIQEHIHQVGGIHSTKLTGELEKRSTQVV